MVSYEDIVENLSEGVIAVDTGMSVVVCNQAAEKITGFSRSLALGKALSELFARDAWLVDMVGKTLAEGRLFTEYGGKLHLRFSGTTDVGITTSRVFGADGVLSGAIALIRDTSGIKSFEAGSLRKERLAYIGTFAASLAHEIKNPLMGIRGAAQLLSRRSAGEADEYTRVIVSEADRLNLILNDMLDFARPARLTRRELNIHRVLDSVVLLVSEAAPAQTFTREYDPSLPPVFGDEGQLTQVFLNLVKNASEALGESGGRVEVLTRMVTGFHLLEPGREAEGAGKMAAVEIRDDGCGIKDEEIERIFTPFYTTKPKGSGLGMAVSLKIIKEHGGYLKIDSTPGEGTAVSVYLPVVRPADRVEH